MKSGLAIGSFWYIICLCRSTFSESLHKKSPSVLSLESRPLLREVKTFFPTDIVPGYKKDVTSLYAAIENTNMCANKGLSFMYQESHFVKQNVFKKCSSTKTLVKPKIQAWSEDHLNTSYV